MSIIKLFASLRTTVAWKKLVLNRRTVNSIAISGSACSGKTTLSTLLAKQLRWNHVNVGQLFRDLASEQRIPIEKFGSLDDSALRKIDEGVKQRMRSTPHVVWEGRLTAWLATTLPDVVSVYCVAGDRTRVRRCVGRENILLAEARRQIKQRDEEESRVFRRLYGITDIRHEVHFDIVLDTAKKVPADLLTEIIGILKRDFVLE
jgi:CMP/dCMP kinase